MTTLKEDVHRMIELLPDDKLRFLLLMISRWI